MIELGAIWLEKAEENLAGAQSELVNGRFNSCANRCYYACFHAAVYALGQAGLVPPGGGQWGHAWVQAQFAGQLVERRKLYASHLRRVLSENYTLRVTADYERAHVTAVRASRAVARTEDLVRAVRTEGRR